jgi:hypothetical protein
MNTHQHAVGDLVIIDPADTRPRHSGGVLYRVTDPGTAHIIVIERADGTGRPMTISPTRLRSGRAPSSIGHCTPVELEPGMRFRRRPGNGELTFAHVDPIGVYSGRRWVRVTTDSGFAFLCRRDADFIVIDDRS